MATIYKHQTPKTEYPVKIVEIRKKTIPIASPIRNAYIDFSKMTFEPCRGHNGCDAILSVLKDGQKPCVDANGRFDLDTAIAYAKAVSQYDLFWYEEPGDPLDFELQATLRNYYKNPMATGFVAHGDSLHT